jgi:hypothetical protein
VKRSIISSLAATAAVAATFALSACGVGMRSQTAEMVAPVAGVQQDTAGRDGQGTLSVRNAALVYPGPQGYKSGSEATARLWLFNNSPFEQAVAVKYDGQEVKRSTIKPGSFERAEVRFKLNQDVSTAGWVPIVVEWDGAGQMTLQLPIAPPDAAQPGQKIELPAEPGGEGH